MTIRQLIVEDNWPVGAYCQWLISAQNDDYVTIEFQNFNVRKNITLNITKLFSYLSIKFFQIEGWWNRIQVYDGPDDKSMLIGELFGTPSHKFVKSIASSQKSILVNVKKQYFQGIVAFVASIEYNKINPNCQSWLDNNILISPINPNINCSWVITRKFGSYITLDFKFMEVKSFDIAVTNEY